MRCGKPHAAVPYGGRLLRILTEALGKDHGEGGDAMGTYFALRRIGEATVRSALAEEEKLCSTACVI